MQPVHAPPPMQVHGPGATGPIAGMLQKLAARHAAMRAAGPGARQSGAPMPLTQRGNPVSPFGHEPPAGPVPQQMGAPRPMPPKPAPGAF